jgi:hypothetical protein
MVSKFWVAVHIPWGPSHSHCACLKGERTFLVDSSE